VSTHVRLITIIAKAHLASIGHLLRGQLLEGSRRCR
jgi:hypothetical protein